MSGNDANSVGLVETKVVRLIERDAPLELESGKRLGPIDVAYETYGQLNEARDNAILICHALSGNAHVAGRHSPDDRKPGWWDAMIGPGKPIDTSRYFVICSNFLGGCAGTTGPSSVNPETGRPYGLDFPIITIADMVNVQKRLLEALGIDHLLAVVGGSIGGMQVLQWAIAYPDMMDAAIPIATTSHLGAQSIAFDAVGRNAILGDAGFANGQYDDKQAPGRGLAIARMIGHITYLSEEGMREKFGRELRAAADYSYDFNSEFAVETYLDYQGQSFVERFDANSYLYITKAADYFDLPRTHGSLESAFASARARFLIVSFSSDWLFTPAQSEAMVDALLTNGKDVSFVNVASRYGHDAFLLEGDTLGSFIRCFLAATHGGPQAALAGTCCEPQTLALSEYEQGHRTRVDYELIQSLIEPNCTVLDVGCGDGELLSRLRRDKHIDGHGIELEQDLVLSCVCRRLPSIQRDIDRGLSCYADKTFDYVILSQTVQTIRDTEKVFEELLPGHGEGLRRTAARRAPGDRQLPELRALAVPAPVAARRPRSGDAATALRVAQLAEHPLSVAEGFRRVLPQAGRHGREADPAGQDSAESRPVRAKSAGRAGDLCHEEGLARHRGGILWPKWSGSGCRWTRNCWLSSTGSSPGRATRAARRRSATWCGSS
jgi:homoserine O-acetyltransferase